MRFSILYLLWITWDIRSLAWPTLKKNGIPTFKGSLISLPYLKISYVGFGGYIPHKCDLSDNSLHLVRSHFLTNLFSLRYLNLNYLYLSRAQNLLKSLNTLPLIVEIHLSYCEPCVPLSFGGHINFTNLWFLDLSNNHMIYCLSLVV